MCILKRPTASNVKFSTFQRMKKLIDNYNFTQQINSEIDTNYLTLANHFSCQENLDFESINIIIHKSLFSPTKVHYRKLKALSLEYLEPHKTF